MPPPPPLEWIGDSGQAGIEAILREAMRSRPDVEEAGRAVHFIYFDQWDRYDARPAHRPRLTINRCGPLVDAAANAHRLQTGQAPGVELMRRIYATVYRRNHDAQVIYNYCASLHVEHQQMTLNPPMYVIPL